MTDSQKRIAATSAVLVLCLAGIASGSIMLGADPKELIGSMLLIGGCIGLIVGLPSSLVYGERLFGGDDA